MSIRWLIFFSEDVKQVEIIVLEQQLNKKIKIKKVMYLISTLSLFFLKILFIYF